ncbi:restriction endonuclease subunit S [Phocaeicola coprophilus]|uniref:restriction endonuclease subunit S n=1 Tax=Phocaeicola coprophilus TaxID=387090 RepID=UPI0039944118
MKQIDILNWHEFVIRDLFEIKRPEARSQMDYDEGEVPFVASGNFNNGVLKYLKPKNDKDIDLGNCITVSPIDGSSFYQECNFLGRGGAGSSIILLYNPNLNRYNGNFIATVIRSVCKKYMYSDMANKDVIGLEKIKLPVYSSGEPNWEYMEQYMKNIESQVRMSINKLTNIIERGKRKRLSTNTWKDFTIGDYFYAINTGNILSRDIVDGSGSTPFVTASSVNNGVAAYIDASNYEIIKGNCILIGGKTFTLTYQKNDFVSNDSHNIALYSKSISNEQVLLYIITVLNCSLKHKYNWGDAVTKDKLLAQTISLPADNKGEPDWGYMRDYIQSIQKTISCSPILV